MVFGIYTRSFSLQYLEYTATEHFIASEEGFNQYRFTPEALEQFEELLEHLNDVTQDSWFVQFDEVAGGMPFSQQNDTIWDLIENLQDNPNRK